MELSLKSHLDIIVCIVISKFGLRRLRMKTNKKMSAGGVVRATKITTRIPNWVALKAKFVAASQGMTMEEKITELLKKDIQYVSSQKWFQELLQIEDNQDFNSFGNYKAGKSSHKD